MVLLSDRERTNNESQGLVDFWRGSGFHPDCRCDSGWVRKETADTLQAQVEKLDRVRAWLKEKPPYNTPKDDKEALERAIGYEDAVAEVAERMDDPEGEQHVGHIR